MCQHARLDHPEEPSEPRDVPSQGGCILSVATADLMDLGQSHHNQREHGHGQAMRCRF